MPYLFWCSKTIIISKSVYCESVFGLLSRLFGMLGCCLFRVTHTRAIYFDSRILQIHFVEPFSFPFCPSHPTGFDGGSWSIHLQLALLTVTMIREFGLTWLSGVLSVYDCFECMFVKVNIQNIRNSCFDIYVSPSIGTNTILTVVQLMSFFPRSSTTWGSPRTGFTCHNLLLHCSRGQMT